MADQDTWPQTIVIAWVDMSGMEKTGRMVMRDLNWFPEFRSAPCAKSCVWLNEGYESDFKAAKRYADPLGYFVLRYEPEMEDSNRVARVDVLKQWMTLPEIEKAERLAKGE